ncbi:FAD-binding protein [Pyxidicoccus fallax]|uniref:FAD-binding protein n=1 Tax=Pyxidicoccus fallax TaxID=394095 RepID=A0A848LLX9_9BACT|nr:FAD-binding protein [Pyxidicoccus fallax]NMO18604.1 FAD-binding protein [Pyxidicoccus fallax]NPC79145.1 FAD-binding protein [Pyxidicoccus fallax]
MTSRTFSRRSMLQSALAAAAFIPATRSWATTVEPGAVPLPALDGQLLMDPATLAAAAEDFGHIQHRVPWAVLVPGSVQDIVAMVRFARCQGLRIAGSRGIGESHSAFGQAQVEAGIVIDMSALATIHEIGPTSAWVDAGVRWHELLQAALPAGKSPPVLTDYIELSIGGTLSVGGIGGQAFRWGLQVDNVLEMDVVTGEGELVRCSPWQERTLFDSVRAGLGQFGIIVRARVRLVDVPPRARTYIALYNDLSRFLADQRCLIEDGRFDYVEGAVVASGGGWAYQLEVVKYFTPGAEPQDATLLAGLGFQPGTLQVTDGSYFDFANRLAPLVALLQQLGVWEFPHPWLDMFVPAHSAEAFVQEVLSQTTDADMGQGPILLYPFRTSKLTAPFLRAPADTHVFLFSLLRTAIPPTPEKVAELVQKNRAIFDRLTAIGGKLYPVDAVPMSPADWRRHFSPYWWRFDLAKQLFDPARVLTPGQGIF